MKGNAYEYFWSKKLEELTEAEEAILKLIKVMLLFANWLVIREWSNNN